MCYCRPEVRTPFCGTWACHLAGAERLEKLLDDARIKSMEDDRKLDAMWARADHAERENIVLNERWKRYSDADTKAKVVARSLDLEEGYRLLNERFTAVSRYAAQLRRTANIALVDCPCVPDENGIPCITCQALDDSANEWPTALMEMIRE